MKLLFYYFVFTIRTLVDVVFRQIEWCKWVICANFCKIMIIINIKKIISGLKDVQ